MAEAALWQLSANEAAGLVLAGQVRSIELVEAALARIEETEGSLSAWKSLEPDRVRALAEAADNLRLHGKPLGDLHGVPVGVDFSLADAAVMDRLAEAGAVILGTTGSDARNPHDPSRSAGRASSGSASAVAAGHLPLAVGVQGAWSMIETASSCGIIGFVPSRGVISRRGSSSASRRLDRIGVLARTLDDAALLADVLSGYDSQDAASYPRPRPRMLKGARATAPVEPCLAWFDPQMDDATGAVREGFAELRETFRDEVTTEPAPRTFAVAARCHQAVHAHEAGGSIDKAELEHAVAMIAGAEEFFEGFFKDYDAILATTGLDESPSAEALDESPNWSAVWCFAGLPALSMPWLTNETGLPIGVQIVGAGEEDDRLLRTAAWMTSQLELSDTTGPLERNDDGRAI